MRARQLISIIALTGILAINVYMAYIATMLHITAQEVFADMREVVQKMDDLTLKAEKIHDEVRIALKQKIKRRR